MTRAKIEYIPIIAMNKNPIKFKGFVEHKGQLFLDTRTGKLYQADSTGYNVTWSLFVPGSDVEPPAPEPVDILELLHGIDGWDDEAALTLQPSEGSIFWHANEL
ncbi:MAG: hypothetical protein BWY50_01998 [Spirochaetes bacterium ADurb.Bin315]|nr:MAG: hypothetical protein BWY50_01998 [Spirochaetes bacterium ADurb.Bin315]